MYSASLLEWFMCTTIIRSAKMNFLRCFLRFSNNLENWIYEVWHRHFLTYVIFELQVRAGFVKTVTSSSLPKAVHLTFSFSKYCPFTAKHASILSTHFFYSGFKILLRNAPKDRLGFLYHLGICFEVLVTQFTFQRWKQPEFEKPLSAEWSFPHLIFLILYKILQRNVVQSKHAFFLVMWQHPV